jgi:hypothetical protein
MRDFFSESIYVLASYITYIGMFLKKLHFFPVCTDRFPAQTAIYTHAMVLTSFKKDPLFTG